MEDRTYLSIAYLGMIFGLAIWTWTVVSEAEAWSEDFDAMENSLKINSADADSVAEHTAIHNGINHEQHLTSTSCDRWCIFVRIRRRFLFGMWLSSTAFRGIGCVSLV